MTKVFVKWSFTNEYGIAYEEKAKMEWFDTEEEAEVFVNKMKRNGSFFKLWKVAKGDYNAYERMIALYKEYEELRKLF